LRQVDVGPAGAVVIAHGDTSAGELIDAPCLTFRIDLVEILNVDSRIRGRID
jgi:hypothetical protein